MAGSDTLGIGRTGLQSHRTNFRRRPKVDGVVIRRRRRPGGIGLPGFDWGILISAWLTVEHFRAVIRIRVMGGFNPPAVTVERGVILHARWCEV